jgi:hypothetical protein
MKPAQVLIALLLVAVTAIAQVPREAHGSADAYAEPGIAFAWGVLRGPSESETSIVIRVVTDDGLFPWLAVVGINPFTKAETVLQPAKAVNGAVDVRIPRARVADFPRTEFRLYPNAAAANAGTATLTIYYLGVPDTTPEFTDRAKLETYLAERIARARNDSAKGKP